MRETDEIESLPGGRSSSLAAFWFTRRSSLPAINVPQLHGCEVFSWREKGEKSRLFKVARNSRYVARNGGGSVADEFPNGARKPRLVATIQARIDEDSRIIEFNPFF